MLLKVKLFLFELGTVHILCHTFLVIFRPTPVSPIIIFQNTPLPRTCHTVIYEWPTPKSNFCGGVSTTYPRKTVSGLQMWIFMGLGLQDALMVFQIFHRKQTHEHIYPFLRTSHHIVSISLSFLSSTRQL